MEIQSKYEYYFCIHSLVVKLFLFLMDKISKQNQLKFAKICWTCEIVHFSPNSKQSKLLRMKSFIYDDVIKKLVV